MDEEVVRLTGVEKEDKRSSQSQNEEQFRKRKSWTSMSGSGMHLSQTLQSPNSPENKYLKRPKRTLPRIVSVEELNSRQTGEIFVGDVMVVYTSNLDKANRALPLLRADLTDKEGLMTITLSVPTQLVQKFEKHIVPDHGLRITNFLILPKTPFDRGDCDFILSLTDNSIVEQIDPVCPKYKFIPDSTIKDFSIKKDAYSTATIGAAVTSAKIIGSQHMLFIKDGDNDSDEATVHLHESFHHLFTVLQQQLSSGGCPLLLFKNITKRAPKENDRDLPEKLFRTSLSTFITELKTDATEYLQKLCNVTNVVEGILTATSIYSTPFEPACDICSSPADPSALIDDGIIYCSNCSEFCPLIYKQCVNATIQTANNTKVQCTIKEPLLHTVLPDLSEMSYTTYLQAKPKTIYMLRKLKIHGKFAISKDGVLLHLYSPSTSAIWEEGGLYVVLILSTPRDMVVSDTWNQNILFKQANSMEVLKV